MVRREKEEHSNFRGKRTQQKVDFIQVRVNKNFEGRISDGPSVPEFAGRAKK